MVKVQKNIPYTIYILLSSLIVRVYYVADIYYYTNKVRTYEGTNNNEGTLLA